MIRGLPGAVPYTAAEPGRFYMSPGYGTGAWLFQCVQSDEPLDDGFRLKALVLTIDGKPDLHWTDVPDGSPLAALDDVHVRIDPTSIVGGQTMTRALPGTFCLDGDVPILCVPVNFRGWTMVDLTTGRVLPQGLSHNWLAFSRWSLVMDDEAGDELTIASFDGSLQSKV